jgi:hypothetical protein
LYNLNIFLMVYDLLHSDKSFRNNSKKSKIHLQSLNLSRILRMVTVFREVKVTVTKYFFVSQYGHCSHLGTFSADVAYDLLDLLDPYETTHPSEGFFAKLPGGGGPIQIRTIPN